jgi:hypothetical protein
VGLAGDSLVAVAERCAPVVVPGHLEDAGVSGNAFDPQAGAERTVRRGQVGHECLGDDLAEGRLLLRREILPVSFEARQRFEGGHHASAEPRASK